MPHDHVLLQSSKLSGLQVTPFPYTVAVAMNPLAGHFPAYGLDIAYPPQVTTFRENACVRLMKA